MKIVSIRTRSGDDLTPAPTMRDSLSISQRRAIRLANQAPMATRISDERIPLHQTLPRRYGPPRRLVFIAVAAIWSALVAAILLYV